MDNEPFVKKRFDWRKHFLTVTPLSKYLAMALFVFLPFAAFVFGMKYEDVRVTKYEPIIVERVFEKEVIVESASTSTPEVKIIIFSGNVREGGQTKCVVDGICSILVSEYEVIWAKGWPSEPVGTKEAVRVGDRVEVYGRVVNDNTVTLYGNENYYIKKVTGKVKAVTSKLRGNLVIIRNEGGLCVYGGCWSEATIFTDGTWEYEDGQGVFVEGQLDKYYVDEIILQVANIEFKVAKAHLFTDTCPTAYDGQKSIYTFYTELGKETVDSCITDLSKTSFFANELPEILDILNQRISN